MDLIVGFTRGWVGWLFCRLSNVSIFGFCLFCFVLFVFFFWLVDQILLGGRIQMHAWSNSPHWQQSARGFLQSVSFLQMGRCTLGCFLAFPPPAFPSLLNQLPHIHLLFRFQNYIADAYIPFGFLYFCVLIAVLSST